MFATLHRRRCIGDAASTKLHRRRCTGDVASARLHRRCWIGEAAPATLHRWGCIGDAAYMRCYVSIQLCWLGMGNGQWMLHMWCTFDAALATLCYCIEKKILWKQNFFAISNIVQNSESKQLGKLFFSDMPIGISCVCLVLQSACEHHTWAGFTILEFFFKEILSKEISWKEILSKDISSKGIRNFSCKEISSIEIS